MSDSDFFKGLVFGAVVGAAAGVLLAPKSGEETRNDIKKLAIDVSDKATDTYTKAKRDVQRRVQDLKEAGKNIDYTEYKKLVAKVVEEFKKDSQVTSEVAKDLGSQLNDDWNEIKGALIG